MEFFGALRRPHAIDLHDDEALVGESLWSVRSAKPLWDKRAMRSGVNAFDHRIRPGRIEVARAVNDAVNVRGAIAAFGNERLRHRNSRPLSLLKLADKRA